jgi:hypothetical protein
VHVAHVWIDKDELPMVVWTGNTEDIPTELDLGNAQKKCRGVNSITKAYMGW